jgi:hypothetical protein
LSGPCLSDVRLGASAHLCVALLAHGHGHARGVRGKLVAVDGDVAEAAADVERARAGTDGTILKIVSPKNLAFCNQKYFNVFSFVRKLIKNWFSSKTPIFFAEDWALSLH